MELELLMSVMQNGIEMSLESIAFGDWNDKTLRDSNRKKKKIMS